MIKPYTITELLALYDINDGDWCKIARAVEARYLEERDVPVQPFAWAHNDPARYDVIHGRVKQLWIDAGVPQQVEHYTIALYKAEP